MAEAAGCSAKRCKGVKQSREAASKQKAETRSAGRKRDSREETEGESRKRRTRRRRLYLVRVRTQRALLPPHCWSCWPAQGMSHWVDFAAVAMLTVDELAQKHSEGGEEQVSTEGWRGGGRAEE